MSQHDYVIANGTGAAVRSDLNNALAAIVTQNSGATAPATTYAYQWWADTTTGLLKLRNAANNAWITLFQLDGEWSTLAVENGSASAPSIYFKDSGTDTGIYSPGTDQVAISTNGTQRLTVDTAAVTSTLPVVNPLGAVGTPSITFTGDLNTGIWSPAADTVAASTGGSERLRIDSSGRVGIGTTSPSRLLHLSAADSTSFSSADFDQTYNFLRIVNTTNDKAAGIYFGIGTNGEAAITAAETTDGETALVFGTRGGGARSERARLDHAGRLLVGTSSAPSAGQGQYSRIVAQGNTANGAGSGELSIQRGETATSITVGEEIGAINFNDNAGNTFAIIRTEADATAGSGDYPGRLVFSTTADGASSPTERMRISSAGTTICTAPSGNNVIEACSAAAQTNTRFIRFNVNTSTEVGSIQYNGSGTNYVTSSDYRLKENLLPLEGAIGRVSRLPVYRFNFISNPDQIVDGFIAHEVQNVVPEAITGTKDEVDADGNPVYQGIDQSKLVPLLTAALQELVAEVESLKAEVAALKAQ